MNSIDNDKKVERIVNYNDMKNIEDPVLREIRQRNSKLRRDALENSQIFDGEIERYIDEIRDREMLEIEKYKNNNR